MAAQTPEDLHRAWEERFNAGDLDGLLDLYEDEAVLLAEPGGELLSGKDAIGEALNGFLSAGADFRIQQTKALASADVAIVYSNWTLTGGAGPDGQALDIAAATTDVARRQADGGWLFVIDNPWGVAG